MSLLKDLIAEVERGRVKRRLKQAFARKPKPAKVRIPDEDKTTHPTKGAK